MTFWITEQGYGNNPIAKLSGVALSPGTIQTIVVSGIVVGFNRQFTYSGTYVSGGTFTYQNQSQNSPWDIRYVSLNVLAYYAAPIFKNTNTQYFSSEYTSTIPPTPVSYQFYAPDPNGDTVTYSLEKATGGAVSSNMSISSAGLFMWDGSYSSIFVRSTSCPYPYYAQIYVVARNSHGSTAKLLVTLNVMYGPMPVCAPPPPDPGN